MLNKILLLSFLMISLLHVCTCNAADHLVRKYIPEVGLSLSFPNNYTFEKSSEPNRRGSFISFNFRPLNNRPSLYEIQFFTIKSIKEFEKRCSIETEVNGEGFCETGYYPTAKVYINQKLALQNLKHKSKHQIKNIGNRNYIVSIDDCAGDSCVIREYRTFIKDTMVAIWILMDNSSQMEKADKLLQQLKIQ